MDSSVETPRLELVWNKEQTTEYLKAILRGPNYRIKSSEYPHQMDLSEIDHLFDEAWWKTANDPQHREAVNILMSGLDGTFHNFTTASLSNPGRISNMLVYNLLKTARNKVDLNPGCIFIHSHKSTPDTPSFSIGDMYFLLNNYEYTPCLVAAEQKINLAAFTSRDTRSIKAAEGKILTIDEFTSLWLEREGWDYLGANKHGQHAKPVNSDSTPLPEIIKKIAHKHSLALYRGETVERLKREA